MLAKIAKVYAFRLLLLTAFLYKKSQIRQPNQLNVHYDYVIGGGTAGCVLAARLSEDPNVSVLLIEAGEADLKPHSHIPGLAFNLQKTDVDWQYKTVPQKFSSLGLENKQPLWPRGKVLGGTSVINYLAHVRGNPSDYDWWERELGCKGWGWKDVLPFFKKLETVTFDVNEDRGKSGPMSVQHDPSTKLGDAVVEAARELGINWNPDYNSRKQLGISQAQITTRDGWRESTYSAYLKPAMDRKNLHVATNSHVTRVILNSYNEIRGVEFVHKGKQYQIGSRKEVILSAGTVGSAQLLMLSGIGPQEHLEKLGIPVLVNSPAVGGNLKDHVKIHLYFSVNDSTAVVDGKQLQSPIGALKQALEYGFKGTGLLSWCTVEKLMFITTGISGQHGDLQLYFRPFGEGQPPHLVNMKQDVWKSSFSNMGKDRYAFDLTACLNHAKSSGRIRLRSSDPVDYPEIDPQYLKEKQDVEILIKGIEIIRSLAKANALLKFDVKSAESETPGCEKLRLWSKPYMECVIRTRAVNVYHHSGTCRMGPNANTSVVDPMLRVHGIEGLRVVDASVFPESISANTNIPVVMAAEKAAHMIRTGS